MAKSTTSEKVPKAMQAKFDSITAMTDEFAAQHLHDEYATLIRQATAALCRKRPSPLKSGRDRSWACGLSHAIGMVNFLFDSSQTPHISASDLYAWFGVGSSTGQGKSKQVRDMLDMGQLDPDWCLPSKLGDNPLAWMISVNGMILDARSAPPEVQEQLAAAGIIPYAPSTTEAAAPALPKSQKPKSVIQRSGDALYILEVDLVEGPVTESFAKKNPRIMRIVLIKGEQSLQDLHQILFEAFDREEEHMYDFQVGGAGPDDPDCQRYGLAAVSSLDYAGDVAQTTLNDLNLEKGEIFGYTFDFGDNWWHVIEVREVRKKAPKGDYPQITSRTGNSPPQYADFD
ncbi:DUF6398 domain-containing protein [Halomicronema sp. CCY15110]|uniref:DUF6398 domain-containing protein n=1 Tax=Halomicronema sp. CCY15110 TaxID=2767773 RepID=UPI001951FB7F|nr:DUF6398 domain-containing protein [Halomicronema sp. CCY15110]